MTPPTVHPKNRNVAASSIGELPSGERLTVPTQLPRPYHVQHHLTESVRQGFRASPNLLHRDAASRGSQASSQVTLPFNVLSTRDLVDATVMVGSALGRHVASAGHFEYRQRGDAT